MLCSNSDVGRGSSVAVGRREDPPSREEGSFL
jgi:hypothetical protein